LPRGRLSQTARAAPTTCLVKARRWPGARPRESRGHGAPGVELTQGRAYIPNPSWDTRTFAGATGLRPTKGRWTLLLPARSPRVVVRACIYYAHGIAHVAVWSYIRAQHRHRVLWCAWQVFRQAELAHSFSSRNITYNVLPSTYCIYSLTAIHSFVFFLSALLYEDLHPHSFFLKSFSSCSEPLLLFLNPIRSHRLALQVEEAPSTHKGHPRLVIRRAHHPTDLLRRAHASQRSNPATYPQGRSNRRCA